MSTPGRGIVVNQIGFRPDDPFKRALWPLPADAGAGWLGGRVVDVIEVTELIHLPFASPAWLAAHHPHAVTVERTPLGSHLVCDFSDLTARGGYQLACDGLRSFPFLIYRDAWKRCFRLLLEWYRIAACGEAVPGYHEVCHLDDCRLADSGEQVDLVGGWHDAGDLRKWSSTMSFVSLALADFAAAWGGAPERTGVEPDLLRRQLERGARYLLKMIDPDSGLVWHSIASDIAVGNESGVWTDNVCGSGDERGAKRDCPPGTACLHVQALAALAPLLRASQPELAGACLAAARRIWAALRAPGVPPPGVHDLADAALRLWQATGDDACAAFVHDSLRALLARQATTARFQQDRLRGYFVDGNTVAGNAGFRGRGGRNLFACMEHVERLAQALLLWPRHADAARWRAGLELLLEGCIEPMLKLSPFRALPACLCTAADRAPGARPLAGDLCFRYFGVEAEGNNGQLAGAGAALGLAARALGQPRWAAYGQKQLEWLFGFNPSETCMMTGLGYSQAAVFSFYVGQIPGAIINGYTGTREEDAPVLCLDREVSPMNMEYWSVHTGALLRALAILEQEPLS
jgi:hypothetical protein